jgi:acetyl esterase/lipase
MENELKNQNNKNTNGNSFKKKIFLSLFSLAILFISFKYKIIFCVLLFIISIIIIVILRMKKKSKENSNKAGYEEQWNDLYGEKISNISYSKNDIIENSFKKGGDNYNEIIGDVNNGADYKANDRNFYNMFIPYSSLKNKNKYNGIILFIHGGAWIGGEKENIEYLCIRYTKCGYITAEMSHTLLLPKYEGHNIFRFLDDINSCIMNIKEQLKNRGFNEDKLELAIGGYSSGAHLTLLYGYSYKNIPIPLKFLIDFVGPISLEPKYWYKVKGEKYLLDNITSEEIEKAIKEEKFNKVFEDDVLVGIMNGFLGKKYTDEELKEMLDNKKLKENNEKYQELLKIVKYAFPTTYINSKSVPTLCQYGGYDYIIGVCHYSLLEQLSKKYGNTLVHVYMKNAGHDLISFDNENGLHAMKEMHYQILKFAKTYFTNSEL